VKDAARESKELAAALLAGGIPSREVASVADMRGFRLFRTRYFRRARVWFERSVVTDPAYEPALYNAARCAAALSDAAAAREQLARLGALGTPLSTLKLSQARSDPDLAPLLAGDRSRTALPLGSR
jgi:hypothetical protein